MEYVERMVPVYPNWYMVRRAFEAFTNFELWKSATAGGLPLAITTIQDVIDLCEAKDVLRGPYQEFADW